MGFIDNTTESHQKQLNEIREASKATETKRAIDKHWRKYQKWGCPFSYSFDLHKFCKNFLIIFFLPIGMRFDIIFFKMQCYVLNIGCFLFGKSKRVGFF